MKKILNEFLRWVFMGLLFIGFPMLAVFLNGHFELPVFDYLVLKIFGVMLCVVSGGVVTSLAFKHLKTGRSTWLPLVEQPKKFIVQGIYLRTRNPMYLIEVIFLLGIFFYFGHVMLCVYALGFFLCVHLFVVYLEEPELRKVFGEEYIRYTNRVPRWFLKQ